MHKRNKKKCAFVIPCVRAGKCRRCNDRSFGNVSIYLCSDYFIQNANYMGVSACVQTYRSPRGDMNNMICALISMNKL